MGVGAFTGDWGVGGWGWVGGGYSPVTGEFTTQRASNAENVSCKCCSEYVSIVADDMVVIKPALTLTEWQ